MTKPVRCLAVLGVVAAVTQLSACAPYGPPYGPVGYTQPPPQPQEQVQYVDAQVLSATPVYQQVQVPKPRQVCRQVPADNAGNHVAGTVIGGALGGLVGNQFGRGSGNAAMTALGAIAGAVAGNSVASQNDRQYVTQCRTVTDYLTERQPDGYDVTYRYNGNVYHTHTQRDPGSTIQVRVGVTPVGGPPVGGPPVGGPPVGGPPVGGPPVGG